MTISRSLFRPKLVAKVAILAAALLTLQAGESKARGGPAPGPGEALSTLTCSVPSIIAGTCNGGDITVGDKTLTEFNFAELAFEDTDTMTFTRIGSGLGYQFQYNFVPILESEFSGAFSYRVSITPAGLAAGNTFDKVQANITGNIQTAAGTFITTVSTNPAINPLTIQASSSNIAPGVNPSADAFFAPGVTSAIFRQTFALAGLPTGASVVNSLGLTLTQKGPDAVPGPLPILGAGAAFGFSRKLRRRVQQAA